AKVELPSLPDILPSPKLKYYRNKLEFSFSNKKWVTRKEDIGVGDEHHALGFHVAGRFDKVLDVDECFLQHDLNNKIRNFIRDFAVDNNFTFYDIREQHGFLRNIIIRNTNENQWMLVVIFGEKQVANIELIMDALKQQFNELNSLLYVINEKKNDTIYDLDVITFNGDSTITEEMLGMKFEISPKAFFQPNMYQAPNLYNVALEFAEIKSTDVVYDLYCGTGTISCLAAKHAKQVIGIESVYDAITDAKKNAKLNDLNNTTFLVGDMKDVLTENLFNQHGKPDLIIVDPPRMGMHQNVVESIMQSQVKRIVYISCNPATQARDMSLLKEIYKLDRIQAVDMFPYTSHVENVILLNRI
ncbi:MAG: 23S rRNA (uracil(1939)-C(5))-methyltransferase RlmD, partial [Bacteroidia bacterium]|nr:23S rRNA (uracil(1939)-C(5))-methyltransferase RlmD [Bacteroidia bacterium]